MFSNKLGDIPMRRRSFGTRQCETANSRTINRSNAEEDVNMGTAIVPDFDSIRERCMLTSDFHAQYGNDGCRQIIAVTKSSGNRFHGDVFRFLCNPKLGARNFFLPGRAGFGPNQFGSTPGRQDFGKIVSARVARLAQLGVKVFF